MSFGSGSTANFPSPDSNAFGIEPESTSTSQQARPLAWHCGVAKLAVTWLGQAFNVLTQELSEDVKKGDPVVYGYEYYAGCAAAVCVGPVDWLGAVYFDGELVWDDGLWASGNSSTITITGRGTMRIYWGTATQTIDATLATLKGATGNNPNETHPAYRRQCYIVFDQLFFGTNKTNAPNIELVLGRWPKPSWQTVDANEQGDCNAVSALYDLLTHPLAGFELADSQFDTAELDTVASALHSECFGLSPVLSKDMSVEKFLVELCEHIQGFIKWSGDGKLSIGLIRNQSLSGVLEYDETDLIEPPKIDGFGYEDTFNEARVEFVNRDNKFKEDLAVSYDLANRQQLGEPRIQGLKRQWVTRPLVASIMAEVAVADGGLPRPEGSIRVKESSLSTLDVGDLFRLSYPHANLCNAVCRCMAVDRSKPGEPIAEVDFRIERPELTSASRSPELPVVPDEKYYEPEGLNFSRIYEIPFMPGGQQDLAFAALMARPNPVTTGANIHVQMPSGSYGLLGTVSSFARYGTLDADYEYNGLVDDGGFTVTLAGQDATLTTGQTLSDATDYVTIALIGDELMSVYGAEFVSSGKYTVKAVRGRFKTPITTHVSGASVWIFTMRKVPAWPNPSNQSTQNYKIQPFISSERITVDLSDVSAIPVTNTNRHNRPLPPENLFVNGSRNTPTYSTGGNIVITWSNAVQVFDSFFDRWNAVQTGVPETIIRPLTSAGTFTGEEYKVSALIEAYTISNATLQAQFGSSEPSSFYVRIYHKNQGFLSEYYQEILVSLV